MESEITLAYKKAKRDFRNKMIISIILRFSYLIIPFFYSYAVEDLTNGKISRAYMLAGFLLLFVVIYYVSEMINDYYFEKLYKKVYEELTKVSLEYTEKNSIYSLSRIPLGEFNSIMTDDINVVADTYANLPMFIARIIELIVIYNYFFSVNILVGLCSLFISLLVLVALYKGNIIVNKINKEDKVTHAERLGVLQEYFFGMKEIKGFRLFPTIHNRIEKSYDSHLKWHTKYGLAKIILKNVALGIIEVSKVLILFYGFYLVSKGKMNIAIILLIYSYFDKMITNVTGMIDFNDKYQNKKVSKNRLLKLEEYSHDSRYNHIDNEINRGVVDFKDVLYGNKLDPILNHFTCHIPSRSITVITGKTGAGKTGIIDLLLKLNRQHEGSIEVDGVDINKYNEDSYFSSVAAVRKNPTFFHMSIRDNLSLIENDFEKIVNVCNELSIHDDIMRLHDGYDTIISENASNIGNDLKYMLSIARVILKHPRVLLFDETLTAFPKEVDLKLMEYFKRTKGKHNVIIISKEKHVIEASDQVIYMIKGENVASGKHELLLEKSELYRSYFSEL